MDLEQTVRAAFVLREPAPDFEDVVMARLTASVWRASQAAPRRRRYMLLSCALVAVAAAAAMIAARHSGSSPTPVTISAPAVEVAAPLVVQQTAPVSVPVVPVSASAPAAVPPTAPTATDVSQMCAAAAAAPPPAPVYTVLVEPLQFTTQDSASQSWGQQYYAALLDQLRRVPGLALVGAEARVLGTKPADFRLTVAVTDNNRDGKPDADHSARRTTLTLQTWTGTAFGNRRASSHEIPALDANRCPTSGEAFNCGPKSAAALDITSLYSTLPRFATPVQAACERASQQLFAQQRRADPTLDITLVRLRLEGLATRPTPTTRSNGWRSLMISVRPELVPPLATALRESADDAFRKEVVTLLAVKFADDPAAREALAAVAASGPDSLMRHVAERAVSGNGPWRDYVVARLRDTGLPADQRLEALYWMADAMPLDMEQMSAGLADVLTALQPGDGTRVLVDLLAGTQKETGEGYGLAGQQGQMTMRQIGSVNHSAAPDLLIACFDAVPNYLTLGVLATRRDDPRVASKLEGIAAEHTDPRLRNSAASYLRQPLDQQRTAPTGN